MKKICVLLSLFVLFSCLQDTYYLEDERVANDFLEKKIKFSEPYPASAKSLEVDSGGNKDSKTFQVTEVPREMSSSMTFNQEGKNRIISNIVRNANTHAEAKDRSSYLDFKEEKNRLNDISDKKGKKPIGQLSFSNVPDCWKSYNKKSFAGMHEKLHFANSNKSSDYESHKESARNNLDYQDSVNTSQDSQTNSNNFRHYERYSNSRNVKGNVKLVGSYLDEYNSNKSYQGYYKIGDPYEFEGVTHNPKHRNHYSEVGLASWYGDRFHGRVTANGEIYNMHELTAAHRTLPLPSIVKVTNLQNNHSVILKVNDRGPFVNGRIIDLSQEAAKRLDLIDRGTAKVRVDLLKNETDRLLKELNLI